MLMLDALLIPQSWMIYKANNPEENHKFSVIGEGNRAGGFARELT
ncbi:MAG TPA: hypothetical protein PLT45_06890 [Smithella sp.]|nr:hypothetical protein [Smithella sp.]